MKVDIPSWDEGPNSGQSSISVEGNIQVNGPVSFSPQNMEVCYSNLRIHTQEIFGTGTHYPTLYLLPNEVVISTASSMFVDQYGAPRWCIIHTTGIPTLITDVAFKNQIDIETNHLNARIHTLECELRNKETAIELLKEGYEEAKQLLVENELGVELDVRLVSKVIKKEVGI